MITHSSKETIGNKKSSGVGGFVCRCVCVWGGEEVGKLEKEGAGNLGGYS